MSASIRIVIADDHPIFRDGLKKLLESEARFSVVGEASNGSEALCLVEESQPDILLLDLAMPQGGLETLRGLTKASSVTRAILLTATIEREQMVEALREGVRGIVLKESATQLLFKSIRCVMRGEYWVGREGVASVLDSLRNLREPERERTTGLTPRELDIVAAIVSGLNNRQIAQKFSISEQTVKHHLSSIYSKLDVSNRLELALHAIKERIVVPTSTE